LLGAIDDGLGIVGWDELDGHQVVVEQGHGITEVHIVLYRFSVRVKGLLYTKDMGRTTFSSIALGCM
jgi:hypothetical protein